MLNNLIDRIKLPFRKEKELFSAIYAITGVYPKNIKYYKLALMHKSVMRKEKGKPLNNERLEYLGDGILDAVVGDIVFRRFEGKGEGFLTNARSKIVQRETLNHLAEQLGLTQLIVSSGHASSHNNYMGGNAFEALVGALYLDRGYQAVMTFMTAHILKNYLNLEKIAYKEVNFKSKLIEWCQKNRIQVDYKLLQQDKDKTGSPKFCYQVVMEGVACGSGSGYSKKESQQEASKTTLNRLRKEPQLVRAIFNAKGQKTKQEENPLTAIPMAEEKTPRNDNAGVGMVQTANDSRVEKNNDHPTKSSAKQEHPKKDEFDLSDLKIKSAAQTREDIIAAAEQAAFAEENQ
ncbi:MAG: ribonuclease III [Prevotella sp.]|nr:ribonuclease III [Prevotella sp.]